MARIGRGGAAPGIIRLVPLEQDPQGGIGRERNFARQVVPRSISDTLTGIDDCVPVDASAGAVVVTLPPADGAGLHGFNLGAEYLILKTDASTNAVTITPATWSVGTDRINGSTASLVIRQQHAGYWLFCRSGGVLGSSNGDWVAIPLVPGALDPIAARRVNSPLTPYGAADSAIVIPVADGAGGWGATATFAVDIATPASNDLRGKLSVTASGVPGANPTAAFTFKDGAFPTPPVVMLTRVATGSLDWCVSANSVNGFTATIIGTPVSGITYRFFWKLEL